MNADAVAGVVALLVVAAAVGPAVGGAQVADTEVPAGDRLQGVVGVQEAELEGELETRAFGIEFEAADSNASKAAVVDQRVTSLEEQLDRLEERRGRLDRARENDSLSEGEYSARMAALVTQAATVERLANRTERAARGLPAAALQQRGVNATAIRRVGDGAADLRGPEVAAVARSVAGESAGNELAASNRPEAAGPPEERGPQSGGGPGDGAGEPADGNGTEGAGERGGGTGGTALYGPVADASESVAGAIEGVGAAAVGTLVGTASAQSGTERRPLLEVPLRDDGSARVSLVLTFDLTSDSDRRAFSTMEDDDQAKADVKARFADRMSSVATSSESVIDREMRVDDARIALTRSDDGETGIVEVSVAWDRLAALEDEHLAVTEPFASGFTPDREFRVRITAPDTYRVTTARPEPAARDEDGVTWPAGTDLDGFTLVFSPEEKTALSDEAVEQLQPEGTVDRESSPGVPGFGVGVAVVGVGLAALLARRR